VVPSTPVRIEYSLTEKGKGLAAVVHAVSDWVEAWAPEQGPRAT
jgi:DNA-binding HxlR family transcriptional regulator